jgi:hypothetical protein
LPGWPRASTHHGAVRVRRDLGRAHDGALKQTRPVVAGDGRKLRSRRARAAHRRRHPRPTQLAPATRRDTSWVPRKGPGYSCYLASPWSIEGNMKTLYTAVATVHGGREGHVKSDDGVLDLDLKIPKSMGGPGRAGSNPDAAPRGRRALWMWSNRFAGAVRTNALPRST